jgi:hypothetical protein
MSWPVLWDAPFESRPEYRPSSLMRLVASFSPYKLAPLNDDRFHPNALNTLWTSNSVIRHYKLGNSDSAVTLHQYTNVLWEGLSEATANLIKLYHLPPSKRVQWDTSYRQCYYCGKKTWRFSFKPIGVDDVVGRGCSKAFNGLKYAILVNMEQRPAEHSVFIFQKFTTQTDLAVTHKMVYIVTYNDKITEIRTESIILNPKSSGFPDRSLYSLYLRMRVWPAGESVP